VGRVFSNGIFSGSRMATPKQGSFSKGYVFLVRIPQAPAYADILMLLI
jgi:hypothetical protein